MEDDAICALICGGLPCSDPGCTSPYPSVPVTQATARNDLVMSPVLLAGLIGGQEINAVGSGSAGYNLERSDGACCEFEADIDTDSNNDGVIDEADDAIEDDPTLPGRVFAVNSDDDNNNGVSDYDELGVAGEDDLVEIRLSTTCPPVDPDSLTWSLSWDEPAAPYLRIWDSPNKASCGFAGPIENGASYPWPPPATTWAEALETFEADITFSISDGTVRQTTTDKATSRSKCTPIVEHAYAGVGKYYANVTGCGARILYCPTTLCGEEYYDVFGGSATWVGAGKTSVQMWGQTGYKRVHYSFTTGGRVHRYAETLFGPDIIFDRDLAEEEAPEPGSHVYGCYLDSPLFGTWNYEYDGIRWHWITRPEWANTTADYCSWTGEIFNEQDQMAGKVDTPCDFTELKRAINWGQLDSTSLNGAGVTRDPDQWDVRIIDEHAFQIWDVHP